MLFRTVYGPEIAAIYHYMASTNRLVSAYELYQTFLQPCKDGERFSTQAIDDALAFLCAVFLVKEQDHSYHVAIHPPPSLRLLILHQMMNLYTQKIQALHQTDLLYMLVLDKVFIKKNCLFVENLHIEANSIREVKQIGGLSQEKIQAWRRVMEFLGVGKRIGTGFYNAYSPALLLEIVSSRGSQQSSLQSFFDNSLVTFLPFETNNHGAAHAVSEPIRSLALSGKISLLSRQDSPSKAYFGEQHIQYIEYVE